jgi:hypothetical protein
MTRVDRVGVAPNVRRRRFFGGGILALNARSARIAAQKVATNTR